jgi:hypothetical protein
LRLLESIARDAAGWPALAVEFFHTVAWAQNLNLLRPHRGGTADLRRGGALALLSTPFNHLAETADMRRPNSALTPGRPNVPSAAVFLWRLPSYTVTHSRADDREEIGPQCYTFSALGNDSPLFNHPPETSPPGPEPPHLPVRVTRRALEDRLPPDPTRRPAVVSVASDTYYGLNRSIAIWAPDWPTRGAPQPVPRQSILPADLSTWTYQTPRNYIALDPELGRFAFPPGQLPRGSVYVSYAYGFAGPIGGGEYARPIVEADSSVIYRVGRDRPGIDGTIGAALQRWRNTVPRPPAAVIEIVDSSVYTEPLVVRLDEGEDLQIRAAERVRPVIRLLDYTVDRPDPFSISGGPGSRCTLDGLLLTGRGLAIESLEPDGEDVTGEDLCEVVIRHSTLVPGWGLHNDCEPIRPTEPSVELMGSRARLRVEHSIIGSILVYAEESVSDPRRIELSNSILDATGHDCDRPECRALTAPNGLIAYAAVTITNCTVFGRINTHRIDMAENSIFTGQVRVARRRVGCMRFCSVPLDSRTPPRYECQPDRVTAGLSPDDAANQVLRVQPQFMSTRYGQPDYARLADGCAAEIRQGADDQSEMGAFHDLYEPQREALLRQRVEEYTPAGMDTGLVFVT